MFSRQIHLAKEGHWTIQILALILLLGNLGACTPKPSKNKDDFVVALENQHETLDWSQSEVVDGVVDLITEPLLTYEIDDSGERKLIGALAKSWHPLNKGKTWQIKLRPGIKWSDGTPLTAQQVLDGVLRLLAPGNPSYLISLFHIVEGVKKYSEGKLNDLTKLGIKALDDQTLNFQLKHPVFHFPHLLTFYQFSPVRKELIKKFKGEWTAPKNFVGLGPYLVEEHSPQSHLKLKANPNYYLGERHIKNVTARYIKDEGTVLRLFKNGQIDFTFNLPARNFAELKKMEEFHLIKGTSIATLRFADNDRKLFSSAARKAIYWAIDRAKIQKIYPFSNPEWYYLPSEFLKIEKPKSPELQKSNLVSAIKDLPSKSINLHYLTSENYKILCEFIQEELKKKLGLEVRLYPMEWQEFFGKIKANKLPLYLNVMGPDYSDAHSIMEFSHSQSTQNKTGWSLPRYDELIEMAEKEFDEKKRNEFYKEAVKLHLSHGDQIPLVSFVYPYLLSKKYTGFKMSKIYRIDLRTIKRAN